MKIKPLTWENDRLLIHPFRSEEMSRFEEVAKDIYSILSDNQTLRYLESKRLTTIAEAEVYLKGLVLNAHSGRSTVHFITLKKLDIIVGMVDLISPEIAREHYHINQYPYFLEFYLKGFAQNKKIMVEVLPPLLEGFKNQGIEFISAVVHKSNNPAKAVLGKVGFKYQAMFDSLQELHRL